MPNDSTRPLTVAEIREDAQRFVAGNPPPQLSDAAIVKLRGLFAAATRRAPVTAAV